MAKGAAWSVPAVAISAAAPAFAGSVAAGCYLTDAQLNAGYCGPEVAQSWQVVGAKSFSTTGGGLIDATTANNFGLQSNCNYSGSVTFKVHNNSGESAIAAPTVTLTNGKSFTGAATLGNVSSGGAKVGFDQSTSIDWSGSNGTNSPASQWNGATVVIPMQFSYTAPDGSLHMCTLNLNYTMSGGLSAGVQSMTNPHFVSA